LPYDSNGQIQIGGDFLPLVFPNLCTEDTNGDGVVNVLDLIDLLLCFGQPAEPSCQAEDINNDGTVNVLDLIDLLLAFGQSCPTALASTAAPEKIPEEAKAAIIDRKGKAFYDDLEKQYRERLGITIFEEIVVVGCIGCKGVVGRRD